uniref:BZIP domain-containing protein n=1 Tax=Stomoxys calcitrans TaxID=35570 RepID=A0A1I8QE13_STOCA
MDNSTLEQIPIELENTMGCPSQNEKSSEKSLNVSKTQDSLMDEANLLQTVSPAGLTLPNINILPLPGSSAALLNSTSQPALPAFEYLTPAARNLSPVDFPLMELNRVGSMFPAFLHRRPRGEKRPIPEEQKDDKYYERRKRNNEAAKKSRDARKIREDRIAFRAAFLEQENSLLRAQVLALRDELQTMRQILSRNNHSQTTVMGRSAGLM